MTIVNLSEALVGRQTEILHPRDVFLPFVGEVWRYQLWSLPEILPDFVGEMQNRGDHRAGLIDDTIVGELLPRPEDAASNQGGGRKGLRQSAARLARPLLN